MVNCSVLLNCNFALQNFENAQDMDRKRGRDSGGGPLGDREWDKRMKGEPGGVTNTDEQLESSILQEATVSKPSAMLLVSASLVNSCTYFNAVQATNIIIALCRIVLKSVFLLKYCNF